MYVWIIKYFLLTENEENCIHGIYFHVQFLILTKRIYWKTPHFVFKSPKANVLNMYQLSFSCRSPNQRAPGSILAADYKQLGRTLIIYQTPAWRPLFVTGAHLV